MKSILKNQRSKEPNQQRAAAGSNSRSARKSDTAKKGPGSTPAGRKDRRTGGSDADQPKQFAHVEEGQGRLGLSKDNQFKDEQRPYKIANKNANDGSSCPQNQMNNVNYESEGEGAYSLVAHGQSGPTTKSNRRSEAQSRTRSESKGNSNSGQMRHGNATSPNQARTIQTSDRQTLKQKTHERGANSISGDSDLARSLPRTRGLQNAPQAAGAEVNAGSKNPYKGRVEQQSSKSGQHSMDFGTGFSVSVSQDLFGNYESAHIIAKRRESSLGSPGPAPHSGQEEMKYSIVNQIYHGKQTISGKRADLLQAKRESRALRKAKQTQIKKGRFQDAFCTKAVEDTEKLLVDELISTHLDQALLEHLQQNRAQNFTKKSEKSIRSTNLSQPRLETPEKVGIKQQQDMAMNKSGVPQKAEAAVDKAQLNANAMLQHHQAQAQQNHEVLSGNSLNMFANDQDGMDIVEIVKKDSYSYRSPQRDSDGRPGLMGESANARTFYNPQNYQLQQVKAAAVAACQAATLNNFYKNPMQSQQLSLKSYLPQNLKDNIKTGMVPSGIKPTKPRRGNETNGYNAGYNMHPLSAQSRKMKRTQRGTMPKYHRQQNKYGYTNADLDNIQDQIRQQVEYQKLLKQQNQIKVDDGKSGNEAADIINIERIERSPVRPPMQADQADSAHDTDNVYLPFTDAGGPSASRPIQDNGGIMYSASKQRFNIQGPILKQSKLDKRANRLVRGHQKMKQRDTSRHKKQYLGLVDGAQYQDKTSESRAAISNNNGGANNELISSFDLNDQSEFNQMSILAMSQGNIWTQSAAESNYSQIRARGKSENPAANKIIKLNKQIQARDVRGRGIASGKLTGDGTSVEARKNRTSANKAPRSTSMNSKNSKKSGNSSQLKEHHSKIQPRFQDKEQEGSNLYLRSFNAERQIKLKLKRAQTEKQEPADRVIEEGSDDDSFASDTPTKVKRTKNIEHKIDDFDQAMNRLQRSPDDRFNQQKTDKNIEGTPGLGPEDNMSNSNNLMYSGSQHQIGSNKKMAGSAVGTLREQQPHRQAWMRPQNMYQPRMSNRGADQQLNINRVIYNKNLQLNRGAKQRGSNNASKVLPGFPDLKQKNYSSLRRKKNQPRIQEKYYNEFDGEAFKNSNDNNAASGKPTFSQRTPQKILQRDFKENSPPKIKLKQNAQNAKLLHPLINSTSNAEASLQEFGNASPEDQDKENAAQQLRSKVNNSRKSQNVWMGGGHHKQLISNSNNSSRYLVAHPPGNVEEKYNANKVALNLIRPNPSFIQGMLLGGSRGSMPANQTTKKFNKIQMNVDRSKFQKIARPYIMSANSVKGSGVNCVKSSIGYQYMPQTASSQISSLTLSQKNQILAAQGLINKTLSTGSMLGPSSNYNQYVAGYQPYQTAFTNPSTSLAHHGEAQSMQNSLSGGPYSGRRHHPQGNPEGQQHVTGQNAMHPDGHTIIASQNEDEEGSSQPADQSHQMKYALGGVTSEPKIQSLKQNLLPASPRQSSIGLSTKQQTNSRRLGTANNIVNCDGSDSYNQPNTINIDAQTSEGLTAYGFAAGLPNLQGSQTQTDMFGAQRQQNANVQSITQMQQSQNMQLNRPNSNNTQDQQFEQMRREPQMYRNIAHQFNETENTDQQFLHGRESLANAIKSDIAPQKVRTAQGQRRKYTNMANSNPINMRGNYKSNTIGGRKKLPKVQAAPRKSKYSTTNVKQSGSMSSQTMTLMKGQGTDVNASQDYQELNDGTNRSINEDMILAVNEQPIAPNSAQPGPRRLQLHGQMYSS